MIERGITFEAPIEIVAEAVVTVEFIDQLKYGPSAEAMNALTPALTAQTSQGLRLIGRNRIYGLFQCPLDFCRTVGVATPRRERCCAHAAVSEPSALIDSMLTSRIPPTLAVFNFPSLIN
jgi:hypothetical protein